MPKTAGARSPGDHVQSPTVSETGKKDRVCALWKALWAPGGLDEVGGLAAPEVRFRGTLGNLVSGHGGVGEYVALVQAAFPDFGAHIDMLIAENDQVVARMTLSGTHTGGEIFGVPASGNKVAYPAIAVHRFEGGKIVSVWAVGDTRLLERQVRGEEQAPALP